MTIKGTSGDDVLTGTAGNDVFNLDQGGNDTVSGLAGNDEFSFGATFTDSDTVNGGDGSDTIKLDGDYGGGLTFSATTMTGVERLLLTGGHDYAIATVDANIAAGQTFEVDDAHMHASDTLTFDGSAETDGNFEFVVGTGGHIFTGGRGSDTFLMRGELHGLSDIINGGGGNDTMILDGDYSHRDTLNPFAYTGIGTVKLIAGNDYNLLFEDSGEGGTKTLTVDGHALGAGDTLSFAVNVSSTWRPNVTGGDGDDMLRGAVHENDTLNGGGGNDMLTGGDQNNSLSGGTGNDTIDISLPNSRGINEVHGGSGDDTIITGRHFSAADTIDGGSGNDTLTVAFDHATALALGPATILHIDTLDFGGAGTSSITARDSNVAAGDTMTVVFQAQLDAFDGSSETDGHFVFRGMQTHGTMTGGALSDTFDYSGMGTLSGAAHDTANAFDFANDIVKFAAVSAIDAEVTSGTLNSASFDSDLATAVGASQLGAGHAVLFHATAGTDAGGLYLIVDGNNTAGYQAGSDLVIGLTGDLNQGSISTANFTA